MKEMLWVSSEPTTNYDNDKEEGEEVDEDEDQDDMRYVLGTANVIKDSRSALMASTSESTEVDEMQLVAERKRGDLTSVSIWSATPRV